MHSLVLNYSAGMQSQQGKVVVIRGEGPKGGPGMPEMLTPTSAIMGAGLGKVVILLSSECLITFLVTADQYLTCIQTSLQECALLTDGRFSGGSHGFVVGHICPEAQVLCCSTLALVTH